MDTDRTIAARIPPDLYDRLTQRAEAEDRSLSNLIRQALKRYIQTEDEQ